jgi:hypothetical protein
MTPSEQASNYLLTNLEAVCSHLFPGGKREGANFIVGSIAGQAGRSFSIALEPQAKRGLYKDFANGDKGSRNLPKLWKIVRGIPEDNHARFFQDLSAFAGMSFGWDTQGASSNGKDFDWPGALKAFSQADAQRLASNPKRQYKVETVKWLHANGYLGLYRGKITFAMRDQTGNVVGVHRWFESEGKLKFLRSPTLLVIGDPTKATILHIHESVWDLVAMIDRTGWHLDLNILLFCTRGVPGAKLVAGRIPTQIQKVYMWEQRDLPDADGRTPNHKWQANVAGAATCPIYVVSVPPGCKDLNEWTIGSRTVSPATTEGLHLACDMAMLYKGAPHQTKAPGQPIESTPENFPPPKERPCYRLYHDERTIKDRVYAPGVYHHDVKMSGEQVYAIDDWLCAPLEAIAKTADNRDSDYGRLLRYKSSKGEEKLWAMPMELLCGDGAEVLGQLLRDGLEISYPRRRKILDYIAQTKPLDFKRCATRTGWHSEQVFVLTEEVIGSSDVWFQASSRTADYSRGGTLDGWQKLVAAPARGNAYLVFAISFGLAGPLMERLRLQGIGCHLFGDSTSGKTSLAETAASSWGHGHSFIQTWNTTSNALECVCAEHSDTILVLDEIKEIDGHDLDRVAYSSMNGQGKIRSTRTGGLRTPLLWRIALLSTGEYSVRAKLAESGITIKAGQELRLVDVPVIGEAHGIFNDLHGARDGAQFANSVPRQANITVMLARR